MGSVVGNSRAEGFNSDPFGEETKEKNKEKQEANSKPIEEKSIEMKSEIQKQKELTLNDFEDKQYIIRSISLTKDSLAFIKVMSKLEHKAQQEYLEEVIQKYKNSLNLGKDIQEKIKDQIKAI